MSEPAVDSAYLALIASDRVSARTRDVLLRRAEPVPSGFEPAALTAAELEILRAATDRILPQPPGRAIDLGARIDAALASGPGDGWRFAELPPDRLAYALGLRTLDDAARAAHGRGFAETDAPAQDAILSRAADGDVGSATGFDGDRMRMWFEDLRADAVKLYVAHPATLARIGYSGAACGGDGDRKQGFHALGPGEREAWEPEAAP